MNNVFLDDVYIIYFGVHIDVNLNFQIHHYKSIAFV